MAETSSGNVKMSGKPVPQEVEDDDETSSNSSATNDTEGSLYNYYFIFWCFKATFKQDFWAISWLSVFIGGGSRCAQRKPSTFYR